MSSGIYDILLNYRPALSAGLRVTMELTAITVFGGVTAGTLLGWLGAKYPLIVGLPSWAISFLLSGIPVIVLLFWLHYPLQSYLEISVDPFITAAMTFTLINLFGVAGIVRAQLIEFPQQYIDAARVSGLGAWQIARDIQFPLVLRYCLPGVLSLQVTMLHMSIFASLISVDELFRVAQRINSNIYQPIEIYSSLSLFFLLLSLPLNGMALFLKRRYAGQLSER